MNTLVEKIDAMLPQTQCGQCGYAACLPYAQAIVHTGEAIDRCPPGGVKLLSALASLLGKDAQALLVEVKKREKPQMTALICETECIACTKCIQACPVDAIIGAPKQAHTVLTQECTGCGLCVEPCPVDCIDMLVLTSPVYQPEKARQRFQAKKARIKKMATPARQTEAQKTPDNLRAYVDAAVARAKEKSVSKRWVSDTDRS